MPPENLGKSLDQTPSLNGMGEGRGGGRRGLVLRAKTLARFPKGRRANKSLNHLSALVPLQQRSIRAVSQCCSLSLPPYSPRFASPPEQTRLPRQLSGSTLSGPAARVGSRRRTGSPGRNRPARRSGGRQRRDPSAPPKDPSSRLGFLDSKPLRGRPGGSSWAPTAPRLGGPPARAPSTRKPPAAGREGAGANSPARPPRPPPQIVSGPPLAGRRGPDPRRPPPRRHPPPPPAAPRPRGAAAPAGLSRCGDGRHCGPDRARPSPRG